MRLLIEEQSHDRDHTLSDYADKLMAAFIETPFEPRSAITRQKPDMKEPLSEREIEVLKLLRSELSGPDIARHLFISINTFRTHTKNIYDKLAVNSRQAAVRRTKELDLF
jgi:LuxR family transcriptional regulator, maltose regulon positive regulatory protein